MIMSLSDVVHALIELAAGRKASLSPEDADALHASADESAVLPVSADEPAAEEAAPAAGAVLQPESAPESGPAAEEVSADAAPDA
jgi:hypothetical protein